MKFNRWVIRCGELKSSISKLVRFFVAAITYDVFVLSRSLTLYSYSDAFTLL